MEKGFYKIAFWILIVVLLVVGAFVGGYFLKGKPAEKIEVEEDLTAEVTGTAVALPSEAVEEEEAELPSPTETEEDLKEIMAGLFAQKYSKDESKAKIEISKRDGEHISGGVIFEGEISGGWFLAAKDEGTWIIVADGNGTVPCEKIEPYDCSVEMVPECWDEAGMVLVER